MKTKEFESLVLESLEHEMGGVKVYSTALSCAQNADLRKEWERYLAQTRTHVTILESFCQVLGVDPKQEIPARAVVRTVGDALVHAMKLAADAGDPASAEVVACECVTLAETKDHLDWELILNCLPHLDVKVRTAVAGACKEVEDQEDEHLYHTRGWCRELRLQGLGLRAVLPPPEEKKNVKTAIEAARAEQAEGERR